MGFLIILGLAIFVALIFVNHKIAKAFEQIVFAKGYGTELNAYYMCFWLGIVGYLYVIALPNAKFDNITLKQQKKMLELLNNSTSHASDSDSTFKEDI
jgi:hypothetical protein